MNLLEAALSYVKRGWYVFPTNIDKTPATRNGFNDATQDETTIRSWWWAEERPVGIGIATGRSNLLVLDFDLKAGGIETFRNLDDAHPEIDATMQVATGGGGIHVYFSLPPGITLPSRVKLLPGMDVRSSGGYVVAPPSPHLSGNCYEFINLTNSDVKSCPDWVMDLFAKRHEPVVAPADGFVVEGGRNDYLSRMAGAMKRKGFSEGAIHAAIANENQDHCSPPLSENEVDRICANIGRYAAADPIAPQIDQSPTHILRASKLVPSMLAYLADKDLVQGEPTGFIHLDKLLGGGKRLGEITAWHAEAKTGKNKFWHKLMYLWLERGIPLAYASRELDPATEVLPDLLSIHFQHSARLTDITGELQEKYTTAVNGWPFYFAEGYGYFPFEEIEEWVRALKKEGIKYFWFDHMHYMLEEPEDHKLASKLIKQLKILAKQEQIHIDLIIQPNQLKDDKKLSLASMKGGSAIGQTIDNLVTLERYKCDTPNMLKVELKAARSALATLGDCYFQYNPLTTDLIAMECCSTPSTEIIGSEPREIMPLAEKTIDYE